MEDVELELRHRVEQALDFVHRLEMPRRIQHEAAPAEARRVVDVQRRQAHACAAGIARGEQLRQRHRAVVQALGVAGGDAHAAFVDVEAVGVRRGPCVRGVEREFDVIAAAAVLRHVQHQRQALAQHRLELRADLPHRHAVTGAHGGAGGDGEASRHAHHVRRLRDQLRDDDGVGRTHRGRAQQRDAECGGKEVAWLHLGLLGDAWILASRKKSGARSGPEGRVTPLERCAQNLKRTLR